MMDPVELEEVVKDFSKRVLEILNNTEDGNQAALLAMSDKIHALSDDLKKLDIYINSIELGTKTYENSTPEEIYHYMVYKIVNAPTRIHSYAAVILTLPYLSDALKKLEESGFTQNAGGNCV
jgi:hypothetical protein